MRPRRGLFKGRTRYYPLAIASNFSNAESFGDSIDNTLPNGLAAAIQAAA